ncbi:MAG: GAF domain-containing protein [Timaviella obliquedivisa GSE-PSE-MK23-08B]|jgi:GAF domain-containing protein|nr:GAF domain-containing protein [Timaviella obliquedivisa GSE-PSE-MK23-08B]
MTPSDFTQLTAPLDAVFSSYDEPEALFEALLPTVCKVLQADRCFLVVRQPATRLSRVFCWRRSLQFPDLATEHWEIEQPWEKDDPMFAAALRTDPSIFVEDVDTTGADVLNVEFERANFGHRALIHAHICQDGTLRGILQPCIFGQPRIWSEIDRQIVARVIKQVRPFVVRYGETARLRT